MDTQQIADFEEMKDRLDVTQLSLQALVNRVEELEEELSNTRSFLKEAARPMKQTDFFIKRRAETEKYWGEVKKISPRLQGFFVRMRKRLNIFE